jgi:aquaporin Z
LANFVFNKFSNFFDKKDKSDTYYLIMKLSNKLFAEFIGTMSLVFIGCGSTVLVGDKIGVVGVSMAFGLSVICLSYAVGDVSGGYFNPAITLSQLLLRKIGLLDAVYYTLAQVVGGICGIGLLLAILGSNAGKLGQNITGSGFTNMQAFIAELVFTFLFVYVFLGSTSSLIYHKFAPISTGLMLMLCYVFLAPITGGSVNPARSIAPAVLVGGSTISELWIYVLAPLSGSALAALVYIMFSSKEDVTLVKS